MSGVSDHHTSPAPNSYSKHEGPLWPFPARGISAVDPLDRPVDPTLPRVPRDSFDSPGLVKATEIGRAERSHEVRARDFGAYRGVTVAGLDRRRGSLTDIHQGTFTFLGFTHYWGKSRKENWVPKRKTSKKSFAKGLRQISHWLRDHRHWPIDKQHLRLKRALQGHYGYFGITGNADRLGTYRHRVYRNWFYWLNRRSHRGKMPWERYAKLLKRYPLPPVRVVHSVYRRVANFTP